MLEVEFYHYVKNLSCLFPSRKSGLYIPLKVTILCLVRYRKIQNFLNNFKDETSKIQEDSFKKVLRLIWKMVRKNSITLLAFA